MTNNGGKMSFQIADLYDKVEKNHEESKEWYRSMISEIRGIRTDLNGIGQKTNINEMIMTEHKSEHENTKRWVQWAVGSGSVIGTISGVILWLKNHLK